ncbi:hypothetical protein [Acinetobacter baumannii]|uniref:hypothetical protein n=1 Tax=Acinetobacter baumannii TaxID=470 RepID=UPI002740F498|nr:hypothetical protein [Acinetobacter baumannii]MDP7848844.1 hypothetical protein [Acinetobacter baumannii]
MKKLLLSALLAVSVTGFTGCQSIEKASSHISSVISKQQEDLYNNMVNTHIRDAFFYTTRNDKGAFEIHLAKPLVAAGFNLESKDRGTFYLKRDVNHEGNVQDAFREMRSGVYNSEKDLPAKYFVDQAKAQGHEVRVYKSYVSGKVNAELRQKAVQFSGATLTFDNDPVFVEYDKSGQAVAIMTRTWLTAENIGVMNVIYTNVYTARDGLRWFENNFSNSYLDNALLRVYR